MTEIGQNDRLPQVDSIRSIFRRAANLADDSKNTSPAGGSDEASRRIHDTVELSGSAQKIVNLQRGNDLAKEARTRDVDQDFARFLGESMADIRRVSKLFNGTISSFFNQLRGRS